VTTEATSRATGETTTRTIRLPLLREPKADCRRCANCLESSLMLEEGVHAVEMDSEGRSLSITYEPDKVTWEWLEERARDTCSEISGLEHTSLRVSGIDCVDCAARVEHAVKRIKGVHWSYGSFAASRLMVEYDPEAVHVSRIEATVAGLGFGVGGEPAPPMTSRVLKVSGMDCTDCASKIEKVVGRLPGVRHAKVDFNGATLQLVHDTAQTTLTDLLRTVDLAGYSAEPVGEATRTPVRPWWQQPRHAMTVASGVLTAAGLAGQLLGGPALASTACYAIAIVTGGYHIARAGLLSLRARTLDINLLMVLAAIGAAIIGAWVEGAAVVFLFSVANLLQAYSIDRTRNAVRSIMELTPQEALVKRDGHETMAPVEQVQVGEIIVVKPGQRIPMDGTVVAGTSTVNEAPITGESTPRPKQPGNAALAGSLNQRGTLEIKVTKPFQETVLSKILHLVEAAQSQRAPTQQFVERFAKYYTPAVVVLAFLVSIVPPLLLGDPVRPWLYRGLALLVVACPCALVISTPISIFSAITAAARRGILIKGGAYLEALGKLDTVVFDKTGTLTWGCSYVTNVVTFNGVPADDVVRLAASIEQQAEHPMAHAIVWDAKQRGLTPDPILDFESLPGKGARARINGGTYYIGQARLFSNPPEESMVREMESLQAEGKMVVLVGPQEKPLGMIALFDDIRASATPAVRELRELGINDIMMLSGDHAATAQAVATKLKIPKVQAELMPEDKLNVVRELRQKHPVAMVGDGVNDAPALAASTVGVAMGTVGTDTALETADVVLMSDDLTKLPQAIKLSRRTLGIIKQNVAFALALKLLLVALVFPGWLTLWLAVLGDVGATMLVIGNALRLLRQT